METILNCIFEKDIPQQFHDKPMIEELIRSYTIQLEELKQVFYDLDNKTDIDTAVGRNLDYIGTIIPLTRKEASELVGINSNNIIMSDERYRQLLKYKVLQNTSECTYEDLMTGMNYIFNTEKLHYKEDERYPATIFFDTDKISVDEKDIEFHRNLCIKPAGVRVLLQKNYFNKFQVHIIEFLNSFVIKSEFYPRLNIPYLQYNGAAKHDGIYKYNGYMTDKRIDFYPTGLNIYGDVKPIVLFEPRIIFKDKAEKEQVSYKGEFNVTGEIDVKPKNKTSLILKADIVILPKYIVTLTVLSHITKYNGTAKYNGSRKYDAKIIKEEL